MRHAPRWAWVLLLSASSLSARPEPPHPTPPSAEVPPRAGASSRMTDAQAAELARESMRIEAPASIKAVLIRLKGHTFKSSKVPERELVLYVQGVLEARIGNFPGASLALKKLEKQWPKSSYMGEAQTILAEDAVLQRRFKEAEGRLHQALGADISSERKRRVQELLLWALVEQGRPQEGLPIVKSLRPLAGNEKPSEKGLVGIMEVLATAGDRGQAEGVRKEFHNLYPQSDLGPRVELNWGRLLGRAGDGKGSADILRKLIKDHPKSPQADDARLALANLLTDGSLPDAKDLPSAEALLAEVRKGGKANPKGASQIVELRLLVGKALWEEALNLVERLEPALRESQPDVKNLWSQAWKAWVSQRLEKGFPGELLTRLKPGTFAALDPVLRLGVASLLASQGLLDLLPGLIAEAPAAERTALRRAALGKAQSGAQPKAVLSLLPTKGDSPDEALMRAHAEAALEQWVPLRGALSRARSGADRIKLVLRLLQRPMARAETIAQRRSEAEGWLARAPESGEAREPLAILVADLRVQAGDARGALGLYPLKPSAAEQRGWVALMRAQAHLNLGQREQAKTIIVEARNEPGFKGQRDALARSLGAY